ncbi:unnamed protein product [Ectocarpus sp. 8 AP-2014]
MTLLYLFLIFSSSDSSHAIGTCTSCRENRMGSRPGLDHVNLSLHTILFCHPSRHNPPVCREKGRLLLTLRRRYCCSMQQSPFPNDLLPVREGKPRHERLSRKTFTARMCGTNRLYGAVQQSSSGT